MPFSQPRSVSRPLAAHPHARCRVALWRRDAVRLGRARRLSKSRREHRQVRGAGQGRGGVDRIPLEGPHSGARPWPGLLPFLRHFILVAHFALSILRPALPGRCTRATRRALAGHSLGALAGGAYWTPDTGHSLSTHRALTMDTRWAPAGHSLRALTAGTHSGHSLRALTAGTFWPLPGHSLATRSALRQGKGEGCPCFPGEGMPCPLGRARCSEPHLRRN